MNTLLLAGVALYGLAIGSFLNVVIYRVPLHRSVARPPSACPGCERQIAPRDNIPVLSWLLLRGRCRHCGVSISGRYPLVEALTAAVFVCVALRFGWSWTLPGEIIFAAGLVALAFVDFDHRLLPRTIVYTVAVLTAAALLVAALAGHSWHRLAVAAVCAAAEFAVLLAIHLYKPGAMGFGDVRFGPLIAFALGWLGWRYAFLGFLAANLAGTVVGLALMAARRATRKTTVPFGVFLSLGAFAALMFGGAVHYPA